MRLHYALVDDLYSSEEFEQRVAKTIEESGGLFDEQTAAMLVVRAAGREHRQIADLSADASLVCFFGKVIGISEPRTFTRSDETPGCVVRVDVGDETGEVTLVLWDERAGAVAEIQPGDVLEVAGRIRRRGEVQVVDMQRAACALRVREDRPAGARARDERVTLVARLLAVGEKQVFTRRDGTTGERIDAVIGDGEGTARLVCWHPPLLEGVAAGLSLEIHGALAGSRAEGREYSIGEQATLSIAANPVPVRFSKIQDLAAGQRVCCAGDVTAVLPARRFITRNNVPSHVRTIVLRDAGGECAVALWGEKARIPVAPGDRVEVYHATVRQRPSGDPELSAGWESAIAIIPCPSEPAVFEGTVLETAFGRCIDDGETAYLLETELSPGSEMRITGMRSRNRITAETAVPAAVDVARLRARIGRILSDCRA
ncbi:MAG: nucleotide-binding protein [Methanomicrobiales archaeon]|nr:nucleotide-binding protein [Methanomicrobiales archaeon]